MTTLAAPEQHALEAVLRLVANGYRMLVLGDPQLPDSLVYVRERGSVRDMVRVYGPDECEAVRMVGQRLTRQLSGTTSEVVTAVLGWWG